jgi:DDE superfamily endonuclease
MFLAKMEGVLTVYHQPYDPQRPMICFDEQSLQLLKHPRAPIPVRAGHPRREDHEYKRNGTRNLFIFSEPKAGKRHTLVTRHRTKRDFAYAMRYLVDTLYPEAACLDVVLDNLNTHSYLALVETFGKPEADRIAARLCFHFTPTHGSWLNMAEIELSVLTKQCLKRRIPDEWTLNLELIAWETAANTSHRQIHWSFTIADARRVFADYYPSSLPS